MRRRMAGTNARSTVVGVQSREKGNDMVQLVDARRRHDQCAEAAGTVDAPLADRYFTDGFNLYRQAEELARETELGLIALEDCRTLEIFLVPAEELDDPAMRPVGA